MRMSFIVAAYHSELRSLELQTKHVFCILGISEPDERNNHSFFYRFIKYAIRNMYDGVSNEFIAAGWLAMLRFSRGRFIRRFMDNTFTVTMKFLILTWRWRGTQSAFLNSLIILRPTFSDFCSFTPTEQEFSSPRLTRDFGRRVSNLCRTLFSKKSNKAQIGMERYAAIEKEEHIYTYTKIVRREYYQTRWYLKNLTCAGTTCHARRELFILKL